MQEPHKVMDQDVDDAHISPVYFWQLNYFLMRGGVRIVRVAANELVYKPQWAKRVFERWMRT